MARNKDNLVSKFVLGVVRINLVDKKSGIHINHRIRAGMTLEKQNGQWWYGNGFRMTPFKDLRSEVRKAILDEFGLKRAGY